MEGHENDEDPPSSNSTEDAQMQENVDDVEVNNQPDVQNDIEAGAVFPDERQEDAPQGEQHPEDEDVDQEQEEVEDDSDQDVPYEDSSDEEVEEIELRDRGGHAIRLHRWPRALFQYMRRVQQYFGYRRRAGADGAWSDDEESMENVERPENITFDQSLPVSHSYLGDLDDCSGIPYIDQETFIVLPILRIPDFILVPGQTMPLNITHPREVSLMQCVMNRDDKTFGVLMMSNQYDPDGPGVVDMGCTAELRSMRSEEVDEIPAMVGIAIGRQRFKLMEERRQPDGNIMAKVQILSDDDLPPPAFGARLKIHHLLHPLPPTNGVEQKKRKPLRYRNQAQAAWLTQWPPWVQNMYDVRKLRKELIEELKEWNQDLNEQSLPTSASEFSYWVASHLLMTNYMRLYLLKIDNSVQRLRCELNLMRKCVVYACKDCSKEIANKRDVFSMSQGGPMAAYVNPSGHIHETLTVYKSSGLMAMTRPSTEHSWFPGYAWSICECIQCGRHMGWKFTATKDELIPKKFWGLTRSALSPKMQPDPLEEDIADTSPPTTRRRRRTSSSSTASSASSASRNNLGRWRPML